MAPGHIKVVVSFHGLPFLAEIPRGFVYVAFASWLDAFLGMAWGILKGLAAGKR